VLTAFIIIIALTEAVITSETSAIFDLYQTTWRNNPAGSHI
jgi:hypothetical protein